VRRGLTTRMVLHEGRLEHRSAFKHEPLTRKHHAIDDRAVEQLTAGTDHEPAEFSEPASVVQDVKEALCVAAILRQDIGVLAI
jgi:hypothetical protein